MEQMLTSALQNPIIGAIGYIISFISGLISINQILKKKKLQASITILKNQNVELKNENHSLKIQVVQNKNTVNQKEKSNYFQENSGHISIDMSN
ncbi:hypothetical protein ACP5PY_03380 [Photobacterium leiognathi subsp. mandapamensis]